MNLSRAQIAVVGDFVLMARRASVALDRFGNGIDVRIAADFIAILGNGPTVRSARAKTTGRISARANAKNDTHHQSGYKAWSRAVSRSSWCKFGIELAKRLVLR